MNSRCVAVRSRRHVARRLTRPCRSLPASVVGRSGLLGELASRSFTLARDSGNRASPLTIPVDLWSWCQLRSCLGYLVAHIKSHFGVLSPVSFGVSLVSSGLLGRVPLSASLLRRALPALSKRAETAPPLLTP
jgi:hypothetical protein